jgi:hypothetical protein
MADSGKVVACSTDPHQTYVLESPVDENINPVVLISCLLSILTWRI